jgi:general secretion pathway protein H
LAAGNKPWRALRSLRGFTLLELMVVVALLAIAVGVATLSLRDADSSKLDEEGARLSALLEGARARSRAGGLDVRWVPFADKPGFQFLGLSEGLKLPDTWLDERTRAVVVGAAVLQLGPEPIIGAQKVLLRLGHAQLMLATDGMGPFAPVPVPVDSSLVPAR